MAFKRYARSALRKGRRFLKYVRKNPARTAAMATQALRMAKQIRGIVNSERMYRDYSFVLGAARSNITAITTIPQGDNSDNRTGKSVLLRSIYLRGFMSVNASVTGNTRISLILVRDNQQISDTTPSVTDILSADDPDSMLNLNSAGRFKIVWRKNYTLFPQSTGAGSTKDITKFVKLYDHVRFNGTTAADVQKHGYYFVIASSESTNFPSCSFTARIGYHDN